MRKKIIAGNWKMNNTIGESLKFLDSIKDKVNVDDKEVIFCVPDLNIVKIMETLSDTSICVGAQNMHYEESGAYTGEISSKMLEEIGVKYVIVGHSERREYFGETTKLVHKKALKALEHNLIPIVCVGESLEDRENGITIDLIRVEIKTCFNQIKKEDAKKIIIAYEPVWAIGTGVTATSEQAEEVCKCIREVLVELYDEDTANNISILYGGSVNSSNAEELFGMPNIDGGLVGGASLKPEFEQIVNFDK